MNPRVQPAIMTSGEGPQAIHEVSEHMEEESDGYNPGLPEKEKNEIDPDGDPGVERVKPDAAAVGIKERSRRKMVEVNQHGQHQYQPGPLPPVAEKNQRDHQRESKVQGIVDDRLHQRERVSRKPRFFN